MKRMNKFSGVGGQVEYSLAGIKGGGEGKLDFVTHVLSASMERKRSRDWDNDRTHQVKNILANQAQVK